MTESCSLDVWRKLKETQAANDDIFNATEIAALELQVAEDYGVDLDDVTIEPIYSVTGRIEIEIPEDVSNNLLEATLQQSVANALAHALVQVAKLHVLPTLEYLLHNQVLHRSTATSGARRPLHILARADRHVDGAHHRRQELHALAEAR